MAFFKKKQPQQELSLSDIILPEHIGIIMDGNGRWAKKRGLPRSAGHTAGAQTFRKIARYCSDIGIKYLTVYAFSTENWRRPKEEIDALMRLFKDYLQEAIRDFKDDSIVLRFIGDRSAFSPELLSLMNENEEESCEREGMVLNIAMNYGGRAELVTAIQNIGKEIADGSLNPGEISEALVSDHLYTKG
ncbi:MAG: di-trans,poly-cis-decaprenylcistransferase, partial [Ruminococcus sp.]|nr:di-trans,poly-cis-decaprenylcistransferase [Ruminococcus sp.]